MKTIKLFLTLILLTLLSFNLSWAQETDSVEVISGETTVTKKKRSITITFGDDDKDDDETDDIDDEGDDKRKKRRRSNTEFLAIDLGVTNYYFDGNFGKTGAGDERLEVKTFRPGSHFALHFFPTKTNIIGRVLSLKSALTIDWNSYYFEKNIMLTTNADSLHIAETGVDFEKNKLTSRYFQIPLLLHLNFAPKADHKASISVGGYAGVLWGSHTKQVSNEAGKVKVKGDFNLNPFRYGLMARAKLRWLEVYASYNLSEMFEQGQGPRTQTFNVGIGIASM